MASRRIEQAAGGDPPRRRPARADTGRAARRQDPLRRHRGDGRATRPDARGAARRPGAECATIPKVPDRNTQWLIGALLALAALLWTQHGATNARLDEIGVRIGRLEVAVDNNRREISELRTELRAEIRELDARVRAVEIELGKVTQRLATLERAILPAAPPAG